MAPKDGYICRRVGYIFNRAVNRHQPQPEEKGTRRCFGSQRLTNLVEQHDQRASAQLIPAIAQGAGASDHILWVRPDIAQPFARFAHGRTLRQVAVNVHDDQHQDGHHHV